MAAEDILLRLRLNGQRAVSAGLRDTSRDVDRVHQSTQRASRGVSGGVGLVAGGAARMAAAAGGFLAVGAGIRHAFGEATEAAKVGAQTAAVIRSTGGAAKVSAGHVGNLANSISEYAAIDDEAIQSAENLLLTFTQVRNEAGKGNKVFDQATRAATDMGVALGTDTRSAAMMLGKALNDPAKGYSRLMRSGVSFTESQIKQIKTLQKNGKTMEAQKLILREVNKEFGGSARAQAQPMEQLKVTLDNVAETLGTALLPFVNKAATALNGFVKGMQSGTGSGGRFVTIIKGLATAIGGVVRFGVRVGQTVVPVIRNLVERYGPGVVRFGRGLYNAFAQAMGPIRPVLTAVLLIGRRIVQVAGFVAKVLKPGLRGMAQSLRGAFQVVGGIIRTVSALIHGDFGGAMRGMRSVVSGAKNAVVGAFRSMLSVGRSVFGKLGSLVGSLLKAPINAVIGALNKIHIHIPKIKIPLAPDFPGVDFGIHIQPLRRGGTASSPLQLVGEDGPELRADSVGSFIANSRQTRQMLRGQGGGMDSRAVIAAIDRLTSAILEHPTIVQVNGREIARAQGYEKWRGKANGAMA